jgi:hypothetical protein
VRQFDDFLAQEVPKIQASPAFGSDGVIVITWDEGADPPHKPGHVLTAVLGPLVRPGSVEGRRWPGVTRPVSQHCEARPAGFEPATSRSGGGRSIH